MHSGNWHQFCVGTAIKKKTHTEKLEYKLLSKGECYTSAVEILLFYYPTKNSGIIWMIKGEFIREYYLKRAYEKNTS